MKRKFYLKLKSLELVPVEKNSHEKGIFLILLCSILHVSLGQTPTCPPVIPGGILHLPDPRNCSNFYKCDDQGRSYLFNCPPGLIYNPLIQVCDWSDGEGCVQVTA